MKKDYYEILDVAKDATVAQIKKKYRSHALKSHPDRVPEGEKKEAEERFKGISEAYAILSDPKKRQMYDQHGHAGIDQNYTSEDIFRGADFGDLGDIFSQMFGGGGSESIFGDAFGGSQQRGRRVQRGADIQYEVEISLEEAFSGVTKKIKVPRNEHCTQCDGSGAKDQSSLKTCETCGGRGQVMVSSGFFRMAQTCGECRGTGKKITAYCSKCSGEGHIRAKRNIDVSIPAGVDNRSRLRVRDEGEVGKDGPGDLYLYVHVLDHDLFQRQGNDIFLQLPISFVKAALGAEISVPTLNGNVKMKIPVGTQSGKTFRLKGKGMADVHGGSTGDQYATVMLSVPTKLSDEQKKLLEDFAQISGEDVSSKGETIKEKIKKVFK
jgi:molecular chaperone DnaJ